jgi:hypothetical protein
MLGPKWSVWRFDGRASDQPGVRGERHITTGAGTTGAGGGAGTAAGVRPLGYEEFEIESAVEGLSIHVQLNKFHIEKDIR